MAYNIIKFMLRLKKFNIPKNQELDPIALSMFALEGSLGGTVLTLRDVIYVIYSASSVLYNGAKYLQMHT